MQVASSAGTETDGEYIKLGAANLGKHFPAGFCRANCGQQCLIPTTERFIRYRKYIRQIRQPSQYRCTQLQYRFAVIAAAPSTRQSYVHPRARRLHSQGLTEANVLRGVHGSSRTISSNANVKCIFFNFYCLTLVLFYKSFL